MKMKAAVLTVCGAPRPFAKSKPIHVLDVDLDLYDKWLTIDFIAHLRSEQRFSGIDALKTQITSDVQQARQILTATGG